MKVIILQCVWISPSLLSNVGLEAWALSDSKAYTIPLAVGVWFKKKKRKMERKKKKGKLVPEVLNLQLYFLG